jgi:hypothetical protein
MTNTELIKTLREGDVISARRSSWSEPVSGKIWKSTVGGLRFGEYGLSYFGQWEDWTIEVLERAKVPFYTNVDRDPVDGDVARMTEDSYITAWVYSDGGWYAATQVGRPGAVGFNHPGLAGSTKLVLLVDGYTGQPMEP